MRCWVWVCCLHWVHFSRIGWIFHAISPFSHVYFFHACYIKHQHTRHFFRLLLLLLPWNANCAYWIECWRLQYAVCTRSRGRNCATKMIWVTRKVRGKDSGNPRPNGKLKSNFECCRAQIWKCHSDNGEISVQFALDHPAKSLFRILLFCASHGSEGKKVKTVEIPRTKDIEQWNSAIPVPRRSWNFFLSSVFFVPKKRAIRELHQFFPQSRRRKYSIKFRISSSCFESDRILFAACRLGPFCMLLFNPKPFLTPFSKSSFNAQFCKWIFDFGIFHSRKCNAVTLRLDVRFLGRIFAANFLNWGKMLKAFSNIRSWSSIQKDEKCKRDQCNFPVFIESHHSRNYICNFLVSILWSGANFFSVYLDCVVHILRIFESKLKCVRVSWMLIYSVPYASFMCSSFPFNFFMFVLLAIHLTK